jgi:hypothetical protein
MGKEVLCARPMEDLFVDRQTIEPIQDPMTTIRNTHFLKLPPPPFSVSGPTIGRNNR